MVLRALKYLQVYIDPYINIINRVSLLLFLPVILVIGFVFVRIIITVYCMPVRKKIFGTEKKIIRFSGFRLIYIKKNVRLTESQS